MQPIYLFRNNEAEGSVRVDRFPSHPRAVTTVAIHVADFIGTVRLEASISENPEESDWFVVHEEEFADYEHLEEKSRKKIVNLTGRFINMRASAFPQPYRSLGLVDRVIVI
jgi:hypothetical protein